MNYLNSNKNESKLNDINFDKYPIEPKLPKVPLEDKNEDKNNKVKNIILVVGVGFILLTLLG